MNHNNNKVNIIVGFAFSFIQCLLFFCSFLLLFFLKKKNIYKYFSPSSKQTQNRILSEVKRILWGVICGDIIYVYIVRLARGNNFQ